jgi:hypothetical protein
MNGPGHYREAEKDLAAAVANQGTPVGHGYTLTAQVHATLALAAATAESRDPDGLSVPDWTEVTR